jgi:threonine/homoserine/homoserine lactone efflux protein
VDPARGSVTLQLFMLGSLFVLLAIMSDSMYALLAGTIGHWLKGRRMVLPVGRYLAGTVYIGLGLTAAFADARHP